MNIRSVVAIAFALLLGAWLVLVLADVNAAYLLEVNSYAMVDAQPTSWLSFALEEHRLLVALVSMDGALWPYYALFWAPIIGLLLAKNSRAAQYLIIAALVGLFLIDLWQLLQFEGGDRKGCEFCFIWWGLHAATGAAVLALGGSVALWRLAQGRGGGEGGLDKAMSAGKPSYRRSASDSNTNFSSE